MSHLAEQLNQFRDFALARFESSGQKLSLDELYDEWRLLSTNPQFSSDDSKAISLSLEDYRKGIQGKPAIDVINGLKSRLAED